MALDGEASRKKLLAKPELFVVGGGPNEKAVFALSVSLEAVVAASLVAAGAAKKILGAGVGDALFALSDLSPCDDVAPAPLVGETCSGTAAPLCFRPVSRR